ncbi:MAG: nucleotidyl transferase AbiEii/AbiGii toxin family protein [Elusimicrobia bacterium]|nr:nucleotidyl transferase AbiEii/AbiGii toxin family protein [Elusimicrobiota bacterium]
MISRSQIEELRDKRQTTELNVAREYVQHLLLSALFGGIGAEAKLAFKGGTALHLLRRSPRFSEDLDFTGWAKGFHVGEWIRLAVREASKAGLEIELADSKPTGGGWFASTKTRVHEWPVRVEWNVSLRPGGEPKTEIVLAASQLWPPYSVKTLPVEETAREKIEALMRRGEPRDFFDLYFLLRERLGIRSIAERKGVLIKKTKALSAISVERDLKPFLPRNQRGLLRRLPKAILQELERV